MTLHLPKSVAPLLLAVLAAFAYPAAAPAPLAAQCPFTNPNCLGTAPTVQVSPSGGSWSGAAATRATQVTITWCDDQFLDAGSREVRLDGVLVTSAFDYTAATLSGCAAAASSTGTVQLTAGSHTLTAQISDNAALTGTGSAAYAYALVPATYGVTVSPDGGTLQTPASFGGAATFTVGSTGNVPATYTLTAACTGTATGCRVCLSTTRSRTGRPASAIGSIWSGDSAGDGASPSGRLIARCESAPVAT
jgi:hypothetical protein